MTTAWDSANHVEWQLIRGNSLDSSDEMVVKVIEGDFVSFLRSGVGRKLVSQVAQLLQPVIRATPAHKEQAIRAWHTQSLSLDDTDSFQLLCIAIASLHAFVQLNWTGPNFPLAPIDLLRESAPDLFGLRSADTEDDSEEHTRNLNAACLELLTKHGEPAYHLSESPFYLVFALKVLYSLTSSSSKTQLVSLPWWALRASEVHRRILDETVSYDVETVKLVESLAAKCRQEAEKDTESRHSWGNLASRAMLEIGLASQRAGLDKEASEVLVEAAKANGLEYELTGALGKRTKFQKEDKTQLVLLAESKEAGADKSRESKDGMKPSVELASSSTETSEDARSQNPNLGWNAGIDTDTQVKHQPATYVLNDDTLLEQTKFTATTPDTNGNRLAHIQPGNQPPLAVTDQCTLLALCLNINNTQPAHGLTAEQMSAFVDRVLSHAQNWSVHTMALLLRSRLESHRTRTVERSTLQLQALIDQMPSNDSALSERLRFFHTLDLPARWEMQAELARRFVALGVLRSALEIFERIQLWEEVVQCLGLLGRQSEAIEVLRDLLEGRKLEADVQLQQKRIATSASQVSEVRFTRARLGKLWCLLGDLEPEKCQEHYLQAWEASQQSSPRAARSLGGFYFATQNYPESIQWLRRAVRINAVYSRSWFMLGCAYMRQEQWLEAAAAFRKCTALEEEDGESWNNLASCYLRMHHAQISQLDKVLADDDDDASSIHSTSTAQDSGIDLDSDDNERAPDSGTTGYELRLLAHKALGVALKYTFESWRVWTNYMMISIDVGMFNEAARALARVVEIRYREMSVHGSSETSTDDVVDLAVLHRLVDAVTRAPSREEDAVADDAPANGRVVHNPNEGHGLRPGIQRLFEQTLLPLFSTDAAILQSYAKFLFWCGEYRRMLDARIKSFQFGLGSPDKTEVILDVEVFRLAANELEDLVDAMENLGSRPASPDSAEEAMPDYKFRARTLVRSFLARTRDSFEDEPEYDHIKERLADLRA
ncbi:hypothetical protein MPSI1_001644 [Malassezia psittaci]|uniref:TPR-like protein n=1 Tax=Malassezia psittaci TaxID=1821823 RepID=A0AAF0F569_9BASI|nr:hypothetical protein MPSI1_001644 [Malassezia psittaci]